MRFFDFSSWQTIFTSVAVIMLVTFIGMGIRLLMMMTLQQRRERQNRQINERLKALIAAYKTLGGSFTGTLTVSPLHLRDLKPATAPGAADEQPEGQAFAGSERARRVRDAVEAALSDIVLFGTVKQVELAAAAMREMVAGRPVPVHELVVSLRDYIRAVLDLETISADVTIPNQGPLRPAGSSGRGGREGGGNGGRGGGAGMGAGGTGAGMGMGVGAGAGADEAKG